MSATIGSWLLRACLASGIRHPAERDGVREVDREDVAANDKGHLLKETPEGRPGVSSRTAYSTITI